MNKCLYCGTKQDGKGNCKSCGAEISKPGEELTKGEPFLYHGYIVWPEHNFMNDVRKFHFYLGERLIHTVEISRRYLYEMVPDDICAEDVIYKLFKVALGEEECARVDQMNTIPPVRFTVMREELWQKQYGK